MKFLTLTIIIMGIIIIFNAGGIETPTGGLVKQFLDGGLSTFQQSEYWTTLVTILTIGIAGGVIAGLFSRAPPESYLIGALLISLGLLILTDLLTIYGILWALDSNWIRWVATSILLPMTIMFLFSLISYWRGSDG